MSLGDRKKRIFFRRRRRALVAGALIPSTAVAASLWVADGERVLPRAVGMTSARSAQDSPQILNTPHDVPMPAVRARVTGDNDTAPRRNEAAGVQRVWSRLPIDQAQAAMKPSERVGK
jgi:hypothetical protein